MAALPPSEYVSGTWRDGIFKDKVVFCTGGAGSICSAQVRAMVYLGANACIIGRNVPKTESMAKSIATARPGAKVIGIGAADVRSIDSMNSAVERCVKELGGIDFVIAGAAGNFLAPISKLSSNALKTVIDIDVLGSYNTLKSTLPSLLISASRNPNSASNPSTGGRIIFVSATLHYSGMPLQTHVMVAKAGVDAMSSGVAIEYGPRGITSNIIAPGPIGGTEGLERLSSDSVRGKAAALKKEPLGRYGSVKEIADATVYLFSDAGSYVNGHALVVDGGSWRTSTSSMGEMKPYPDFLLTDAPIMGVKGQKKDKSKL